MGNGNSIAPERGRGAESADAARSSPLIRQTSSVVRVSRRDVVRRKVNFLDDDPSTMTYARRAAMHLASRYRWYNPRLGEVCGDDGGGGGDEGVYVEMDEIVRDASTTANGHDDDDDDDEDKDQSSQSLGSYGSFNRSMRRAPTRPERPSLEKAWAYFEHVTLPRYLDHSTTTTTVAHSGGRPEVNDEIEPGVATAISADEKKASDDDVPRDGGVAKTTAGGSGVARFEKRNELLSRWAVQWEHRKAAPPTPQKETNLDAAMPFYDRWPFSTLRGIFGDCGGEDVLMDLAEPGEDRYPTRLYSPLHTPMDQMGDFGLGVGLYFTALRCITILSFIAGLINIPNMIYYGSTQYSNGQEGVATALKGSAVCTVQSFVPCPSCTIEDFADVPHRIATHSSVYSDRDMVFVVKNFCDGAKLPLAFVNYLTLLLIIFGMARINRHLKEQEVTFDEDEQTAQDYSIVVKNPPPDATDPEEWKSFFDTNFGPGVHVTCCTVARDNYLLVRALVRRREILQRLKWNIPPGTPLDVHSLTTVAKELQKKRNLFGRVKSFVIPDVPTLLNQLVQINSELKRLSSRSFPATRIFVTFETEGAQRAILKCLSVGTKIVRRNDILRMDNTDHLFRSRLVLNIKEAEEPSTIRWQDLSDRYWDRLKKLFITAYAWACAMALVASIVRICRRRSAKFAAYAIAFFNSAFPEYAKILVNIESHPSEGRRQTSLYTKILAFRWINTAIIVTMITPFTSTLSSGSNNLLDGVCEIFFAEIVTSNVMKFADPVGFVQRHYLAPRAGSQEEMNSHMRGEEWHLAERYSNMSKILFLTLWYCSIYPFGFFLCALALFINNFADRFSLMRTWRQAPRLGAHSSSFLRRYVFTSVISAMAVASSYYWAGFPYDNLCENEDPGDDDGGGDDALKYYIGTWNVVSADGSRSVEVTVLEGDPSYRFCQQSLYWYGKGVNFPAIPFWQREGDEWMTREQELLTNTYGWSSLFLMVGVCLWIIKISIHTMVFRSNHKSCGEDQGIPFSDVVTISSYVPEVKSDLFSYPLLAVDTDDVDEELYEWKDTDRPYSYYDLTRDAREILKDSMMPKNEVKSLFSTIKHWHPDDRGSVLKPEEQNSVGEFR